ncbi:hypothetical protein GCM10010512_00020 [Streptomyces thermoviolaceus subsp. thermoviolaceus]|nr:hypothetical protein GCM10010499_52800 [Streptomyces thermoviolaceus subsp. apingens]GHA73952.1 hypothetical protein GCM10010512_00020 [Streptomyces thermoviolaceus subsp. thermoviolaceus]
MTAERRSLGTGPVPFDPVRRVRAAEADLSGLPAVRLPDLPELRSRGVLGASQPLHERGRRSLGPGPAAR